MTFEDLVHKVLHEPGFWNQLKSDPEKALKSHGFQPTPAHVAALKKLDYNSIQNVAQTFQRAQGKQIC